MHSAAEHCPTWATIVCHPFIGPSFTFLPSPISDGAWCGGSRDETKTSRCRGESGSNSTLHDPARQLIE